MHITSSCQPEKNPNPSQGKGTAPNPSALVSSRSALAPQHGTSAPQPSKHLLHVVSRIHLFLRHFHQWVSRFVRADPSDWCTRCTVRSLLGDYVFVLGSNAVNYWNFAFGRGEMDAGRKEWGKVCIYLTSMIVID